MIYVNYLLKGGKRVVKQNHLELQDYCIESSKTEQSLLVLQSADQNTSSNKTNLQETIESEKGKSEKVK